MTQGNQNAGRPAQGSQRIVSMRSLLESGAHFGKICLEF